MYKTVPILREIKLTKREVYVSLQTFQGYHLEEIAVRPSAIEVKLTKDGDSIFSEFALPTTIDNASPSVDWSHVDGGDRVQLTFTRALKTLPGLHPRREVRLNQLPQRGSLPRVTLAAG